jgi:hypothetical protein
LTIFLRPKLKNHKILAKTILLIAAGLQMLLWTAIYIKSCESVGTFLGG